MSGRMPLGQTEIDYFDAPTTQATQANHPTARHGPHIPTDQESRDLLRPAWRSSFRSQLTAQLHLISSHLNCHSRLHILLYSCPPYPCTSAPPHILRPRAPRVRWPHAQSSTLRPSCACHPSWQRHARCGQTSTTRSSSTFRHTSVPRAPPPQASRSRNTRHRPSQPSSRCMKPTRRH